MPESGDVGDSPECCGGFGNIVVRNLLDVQTLLGIDGGVTLDTSILHHYSHDEPRPPYEHEICITIGANGVPIALSDITRALMSISRDAWRKGEKPRFGGHLSEHKQAECAHPLWLAARSNGK